MRETVSYSFTTVNKPLLTNFCTQSAVMPKQKMPAIVGPHKEFALRFRQALRFKKLLAYDETTEEKLFGSYEKAAKALGISRVYVGDLFRGIEFPSGTKGRDLAERLGVSHGWFVGEPVPMISGSLISIEHLDEEDKKVVLSIIKSMERKAGER